MYVPLQVHRFQKSILLIVQYKYLKSCSEDFYSLESDPPHKIMWYWFYLFGFFISARPLVGDGVALHSVTRGRRGGPVQCFGCQEMGHIITNCPHKAQGTSAPAATVPYNRPSATYQRPDTSAQCMARDMDASQRFQEASAAERRMEASTQKLLLLCEHVELVCDQIPGAAAAERAAGVLHTLSLPQAEAREHKVRTGQDDVEEMARAMEAACRCEIVADTTQALDADLGKFHNTWEHARPHQIKRWGEGP